MERIMFMVFKLFVFVPYWFYTIVKMGKPEKYTVEEKYSFLHNLVRKVNKAGRVEVQVFGQEYLPEKNGYIMFPNHQGKFDALAMIEASKKPFTVVLKKELKDVVLVKQIIQLLDALTLDREDVRDAFRVIKEVSENVLKGRNYVIFPEGTRSEKGNQLLDFKAGTFKSAINAKCPIVPVALIDCFKPFDIRKINKVTVQVHFLPPIYYDEYKEMKSKEIAALVKCRIEETILKNE